jgi:hypothetical protein
MIQLIHYISLMQSSIFNKIKISIRKKWKWNCYTTADLVNWFVDWVSWANVDACNLILSDVMIARFVVNCIK